MNADYTMVAEARGQRVLWFRRLGSYQGDWLLLSRSDDLYHVYKDYYGSCSGCDAIEGTFYNEGDLEPEDPRVQEFIQAYHPFLELKPESALRIAERDGNLLAVLPRNRREWYDAEWNNDAIGRQLALIVKSFEGAISASEIPEIDNLELRREALEKFGAEKFALESGAVEVDREGEDVLMRIERSPEDFVFLYLKDGSSDRRYILRVNPIHTTVRGARAASFGFSPESFILEQET